MKSALEDIQSLRRAVNAVMWAGILIFVVSVTALTGFACYWQGYEQGMEQRLLFDLYGVKR